MIEGLKKIYRFVYRPHPDRLYGWVEKKRTKIFGLKYRPSLKPWLSDKADGYWFYRWLKQVREEFSKRDARLLRDELKKLDPCRLILEIGVDRRVNKKSSTKILLENKAKETVYLGVDIKDKGHLNDKDRRVFTLKTDSRDRNKVLAKMEELGSNRVDMLVIDGWHSVEMAVNDWEFARYVRSGGAVVLHDTSVHPGPYLLFEAIDERVFDKYKHFAELKDDWGIAIARRR